MSLFDNPTQALGIFAFSAAFLSGLYAGRVTSSRFWYSLSALYLLLVLEMFVGWRHGVRMKVNDVMQSMNLYDDRAVIQWALIGILILVLLGCFQFYRISKNDDRSRTRNQAVPIVATAILVLLFMIEIISFHEVDALLYREFSGIMAIAWMWAMLAIAVITTALRDVLVLSDMGEAQR